MNKLNFNFRFSCRVRYSFYFVALAAPLATHAAIYGLDNRLQYSEVTDLRAKEMSKSVALVISKHLLKSASEQSITFRSATAKKELDLCSDERFGSEPVIGTNTCTAFLISKRHVLTAGHCIRGELDCIMTSFVFDFSDQALKDGVVQQKNQSVTFQKNRVYSCARVIESSDVSDRDYALVELDRDATAQPLSLGSAVPLIKGSSLQLIGHPVGLPIKFDLAASVFSMDLSVDKPDEKKEPAVVRILADSYGGNSGSPVVDSKNGKVVGIFIKGPKDFETAAGRSCMKSVTYVDPKRGSGMVKIDAIRTDRLASVLNHR